jgi:hypothetical protein
LEAIRGTGGDHIRTKDLGVFGFAFNHGVYRFGIRFSGFFFLHALG